MSINPQTERKESSRVPERDSRFAGTRMGWPRASPVAANTRSNRSTCLGNIEVEEFATTAYRINLRASNGRIVTEPCGCGAPARGRQDASSTSKNALALASFVIEVEDIVTGKSRTIHDMEICRKFHPPGAVS